MLFFRCSSNDHPVIFRLRHGSVQSKIFSIIIVATLSLAPLTKAYAAFGDGTPTIPNADVFTRSGKTKVDGTSGALTQQFSLDIPPGRSGLQPDLSLQYNSQNAQDGIVGYGWSLSAPYIQRLNKTGIQNLYSSTPYFTSSIDGELAYEATSFQTYATTSASIMDSLDVTIHAGVA
jgi:hypothetical protein